MMDDSKLLKQKAWRKLSKVKINKNTQLNLQLENKKQRRMATKTNQLGQYFKKEFLFFTRWVYRSCLTS